jgi:hypothetical protein
MLFDFSLGARSYPGSDPGKRKAAFGGLSMNQSLTNLSGKKGSLPSSP